MTLRWSHHDGLRLHSMWAGAPDNLRKAHEVFKRCAVPADETLRKFDYARVEQLVRAHDLTYVEDVRASRVANGFGNGNKAFVAHATAAVGCMIAGVEAALDRPSSVVCAPVSGFHHAHFKSAEGFCTFNGLAVAIACARLKRRMPHVLIIDGDAHYGNGTADIISRLGWAGVHHLTHDNPDGGQRLSPQIWEPQIRGLLTNRPWDLVLYQAGADAHVDDPYGAGYLNDDDWEARDQLVFQYCARLGLPLVFNLAGGYNGERTLELHAQTVRTARQAYAHVERQAQPA